MRNTDVHQQRQLLVLKVNANQRSKYRPELTDPVIYIGEPFHLKHIRERIMCLC